MSRDNQPILRPRQTWRQIRLLAAEYLVMVLVLVALIAYFSRNTGSFWTVANFNTLANRTLPGPTVLAVGMTLVLIVGGIDLSVGSVLGLSGAVMGLLVAAGDQGGLDLPLWVGCLACLGTGLAAGAVNGLVTVGWTIPSFIVTLGMLEVARGLAYLLAESRTAYIGQKVLVLSQASVGRLDQFDVGVPFLAALACVVAGQFLLSRTVFGRNVVAIGSNEEAARLAGIRPRSVKVVVFMLSGATAAVGAIIEVSKQGSASPNAGYGYELEAIAAVVVGGTSLLGGRGSVIGTFLGVLIITVLGSGLTAMDVKPEYKRLITGAVIVAAVIADRYRARLAA